MDLSDRFAIRYYEWSLQRAKEELQSGFPLLSGVRNTHAFKLIDLAEKLTPGDRENLLVGLVKRFHVRAAQLGSFEITPHEKELIDLYMNQGHVKQTNGRMAMLPFASAREKNIREELDANSKMKPDRKAVKKLVAQNLTGSLGSPTVNKGGVVEYETNAPHWRVRTDIDFGHTWEAMISYSHVILRDGSLSLQPPMHICGWMGLAGQTSWDLYTVEDTAEVADSIVTLITWFLGRWQELLPV